MGFGDCEPRASRFNRWFTISAYDIAVPSCLLASMDDVGYGDFIETRKRQSEKFGTKKTATRSRTLEESCLCFICVNG